MATPEQAKDALLAGTVALAGRSENAETASEAKNYAEAAAALAGAYMTMSMAVVDQQDPPGPRRLR